MRARRADIAVCTLNSDSETASCGCQSMPADTGNPAQVSLTESLLLAPNRAYRELLRYCSSSGLCTSSSADDTTTHETLEKTTKTKDFCDQISSGDIWSSLIPDAKCVARRRAPPPPPP